MRFVVTGTGRSGTRWASEVLGVGHQAMFTGDGFVDSDAAGDVSFWAASQNLEGWRVVLLVRDPRLVVASWLATGEFEAMLGSGHWRLWQHCKKIDPYIILRTHSTKQRLEAYWAAANMHLADRADVVLRLEGLAPSCLSEAVLSEFDYTAMPVPESDTEPVTLQDEYAISVAREFGYDC